MIALPAVLLSNWRAIAAAAALVAAGVAGWTANGWRLEGQIAEIRQEHADQVASASQRQAAAQLEQRTIEQAREASKQEIDHVSSLARARADDDRRGADVAHERLLYSAALAAARAGAACQGPAPAAERPAAQPAGLVLADVLGRADAAAGELAAVLDASHAAGAGCERYVDELTSPGS